MPTLYANCAPTYQVVSEYPTNTVVNAGVTIFATDFASIPTPPAVPSWTVVLTQPSAPTVTITTFENGGPTITSGTNVSATFKLQSGLPGGYIQPGAYSVQFSDGTLADTVTSATKLTISPSPTVLSPSSGPTTTTTTVNANATGFLPSAGLTVKVDGQLATINSGGTSDIYGNASVNFTPPLGTPTGAQSVIISDGTYTLISIYTVASTVGGPWTDNLAPYVGSVGIHGSNQLDPILEQLEFGL